MKTKFKYEFNGYFKFTATCDEINLDLETKLDTQGRELSIDTSFESEPGEAANFFKQLIEAAMGKTATPEPSQKAEACPCTTPDPIVIHGMMIDPEKLFAEAKKRAEAKAKEETAEDDQDFNEVDPTSVKKKPGRPAKKPVAQDEDPADQ